MTTRRVSTVLALALALAACPGSWRRPEKPPGSAAWVAAGATLDAAAVAELRDAGVGEVFVEVASLAGDVLAPLPEVALPPGTPTTLVVTGELPDAETWPAAERLAGALRDLRFAAEARGLVPVGVHLDLRASDAGGEGLDERLEAYGDVLADLRGELHRSVFLSASVERGWLGARGLAELAAATDFLVPFVYGQRPEEEEDVAAWDLTAVDRAVDALEELGEPYLLGVVTVGTATHRGRDGAVAGRTTDLSLERVFWNRDLQLVPGFTLQGGDRQIFDLEARRATRVGDLALRPGDRLRLVGLATADLAELVRRLGARDLERHLGRVYYRLPGPEERLSLGVGNLAGAERPEPASPDLALSATVQRRTARGYLLRFAIANRNGEATDLSLLENNYLQVELPRGEVGDRVDVGAFHRYDLGHAADGTFTRSLRTPSALRLHVPLLDRGQTVESGDVEVRQTGVPELVMRASFLLPDGRTLVVGPVRWRDGKLVDPPPTARPPAGAAP